MYYREEIPQKLMSLLREKGFLKNRIELCVKADLDNQGNYGDSWVAATKKDLILLDSKDIHSFTLVKIEELKVENLVSTGILIAKVGGIERTLSRFSNTWVKKFSGFAKLVTRLKEGEKLSETEIAGDNIAAHCPRCGRRFPDPQRQICPKCLDKGSLFLRVLSYLPRYRNRIALIFLFILASSLMKLCVPFLGGRILFDQVLTEGGRYYGQIIFIILLMVGTQVLSMLLDITYGRINAKVTAQVFFDLKTDIFTAMQRLSLSFFNKKQTGGLMTRVNWDALQLQYFFIDGVPYLLANSLTIIGVGTIMMLMNWKLALFAFIPAPVIVLLSKRLFPRLWSLFSRLFRKRGILTSLVNDTLTGFRVVKAFGKEDQEVERFVPVNQGLYAASLDARRLSVTVFPFLLFIMQLGGLIVWAFGGWRVVSGSLTFGTLMTFVGYLALLYGPLQFMTMLVEWWTRCMNAAQRIFEILDSQPEVRESPKSVRLPEMEGRLSLRDVTFSYEPNKPVLHSINLEVASGEMIGLVGHTGAGKSTLTNLITRLYDVEEGEIRIDGVNIKDVSISDLRSQIGIVLQDTYLFTGTIAENIAYAKPDAGLSEIIKAAKAANAHDFIVKQSDGYDTLLGKKGVDLSGGERQRIAIARALLRDPRILIFDEATSSVDTRTEQKIQQAIGRMIRGRTTIAIAHRLSTLRRADRIVILEKGKVLEAGTHTELMGKKGSYHKMVNKEREALKIIGVGTS
jgi:ATP-binding cassette subfamily B protein